MEEEVSSFTLIGVMEFRSMGGGSLLTLIGVMEMEVKEEASSFTSARVVDTGVLLPHRLPVFIHSSLWRQRIHQHKPYIIEQGTTDTRAMWWPGGRSLHLPLVRERGRKSRDVAHAGSRPNLRST